MIGISALTEFSSDESEDEPLAEATKEAKESEAFALYNDALQEQRSGNHDEAEALYHSLLQSRFLEEVEVPEEGSPLVDPAAMLKYSAYKNLGNLALQSGDKKQATEYLLEAVCLDSTDVTLWYRIGQVAVDLIHLPLANISFREALRCNPNHWPSLNSIITVLYAISDYSSCLSYVAKILQKDSKHVKAHAFKTQILKEDAYSRRHADVIFKHCAASVHSFRVKKEDVSKFVDEAIKLREVRRKLAEVPPLPVLKLQSPFKEFRWKHLGEQLIQLYDYIDSCDPPISFGCRVDLSPCWLREVDSSVTSNEKATTSSVAPSGPSEDPAYRSNEERSDGETVAGVQQSDGAVSAMETDEGTERQTEGDNGLMGNVNQGVGRSSDSQVQTTDVSGTENEEAPEKIRKSHKKKRGLMSEPAPGKRRSARVRNTEKKKEVRESINYQELLQRFLPSTLIQSNQEEPVDIFESPSAQPQRQSANAKDLPDLPVTSDLAEVEVEVVEEFVKSREKNGGVVSLMEDYLMHVSKQFHLHWPRKLSSIYVEVYKRMRKHITIPAIFFKDHSDSYKRNLGRVILVYMELCIDKGRVSKVQDQRFGDFFQQDMFYLEDLGVMETLMQELLPDFAVRVYWMKAHHFASEGKTAEAVHAYHVCHELLPSSDLQEKIIHLPNIIQDKIITREIVESRKDSLRRTQSHEEILKLFEEGHYERVVDILRPVVDNPRSDGEDGEHLTQRLMLVEASLKIEDHKNVVICFYKILKELWEEMHGFEDFQSKVSSMEKIDKFFNLIVRPISKSSRFLRETYHPTIVQLTHLLIELISWSMENFEVASEGMTPPAPTIHPWILLYHIIKNEEVKLEEKKIPAGLEKDTMATDDRSDSPVPLLPSSIMLLDTAHEYLGRKSWCCNSDGALLKLTARVLSGELDKTPDETHPFSEDIQQSLEQCFYCLYGHPHKRAKAKHLQDHGVEEVPLTWSYGKCMFAYFKPKLLPEFDGYKTSSMSGDLENLFLRITKVIPTEERPEDMVEKIHAYIDGLSDDVPMLSAGVSPNSPVVTEIFYLLADYYFKNKEFGKANKFYINDICFCPSRLDSWAGLALAKSGRLELKLNSCDAKAEGGVYKQGMGSLRCFHRALEIDQSNRSLWIEYGSFAYILQSHASRQLKQQEQIQLSDESVEGLKVKQAEMLTLAEECFRKVNQMGGDEEGEEWLIHYMLGKISEKRGEVIVALRHYLEAMAHLHGDGAKFPKKISYHNPPDLALESLEMYFRIHAAVLKSLEENQSNLEKIDFKAFEEILHSASIQPFVNRQENKLSEISSEHSTDAEQDGIKLALPPIINSSRSNSPRFFTAPQDHDYARRMYRKSRGSSQEDAPTDTASEGDIFSGEESITGIDADAQHLNVLSEKPPLPPLPPPPPPPLPPLPPVMELPETTKSQEEGELTDQSPETSVTAKAEKKEEPVSSDAKEEREAASIRRMVEGLSNEERFKRLVELSINAMHLCLQRFPQHYKSLYRIAHWHLTSETDRNLQWCRDLLLGSTLPWQQMSHMPSPALFGEHNKTKNIFQGIWRIPIADIDRSGSFSWHMYRSVTLLIDVLEAMKDDAMLLQLATKLAKTPEQGKKFLRDSDRPHLATRAYQTCQKLLAKETENVPSLDETEKFNLLMKIWQTLSAGQLLHLSGESKVARKSLATVYKHFKGKEIEDEPSVFDQASRFCQHVVNTSKLPQTPTQGDYHKFVRSGSHGSPLKAPSSPGLSKTSEKVTPQVPSLVDKGPQQSALPSAGDRIPPQVKEVLPSSSFMMSSILAPDTERKKQNQAMKASTHQESKGDLVKDGVHVTPQQENQTLLASDHQNTSKKVSSVPSDVGGALGRPIMLSQGTADEQRDGDRKRGKFHPCEDESGRDFKLGSPVVAPEASWKVIGEDHSQAKIKEKDVRVERQVEDEEPKLEQISERASPGEQDKKVNKKIKTYSDGRSDETKMPHDEDQEVDLPDDEGFRETHMHQTIASKLASAVAAQDKIKLSSPTKNPHHVEDQKLSPVVKQKPLSQPSMMKGVEPKIKHLKESSEMDKCLPSVSSKPYSSHQDSSSLGTGSNQTPVPDLGQHLSSLLQRVRAGVNVNSKSKWRKPSGDSSQGGQPTIKSKSSSADVKGKEDEVDTNQGINQKSSYLDSSRLQVVPTGKESEASDNMNRVGVSSVSLCDSRIKGEQPSIKRKHSGTAAQGDDGSFKKKSFWLGSRESLKDKGREDQSSQRTHSQGISSSDSKQVTNLQQMKDVKRIKSGKSSALVNKPAEPSKLGEKRKLSYPEILDSLKRSRFDLSLGKKKLLSKLHLQSSQEKLAVVKVRKVGQKSESKTPLSELKKQLSPTVTVIRPEKDSSVAGGGDTGGSPSDSLTLSSRSVQGSSKEKEGGLEERVDDRT